MRGPWKWLPGQSPNLLPPVGAGAVPQTLPRPGGTRVAGLITPGSPEYDAITEQVQSIFGRTADLPQDNPYAQYLSSIGYADANPAAFPERTARQELRRGSLNLIGSLLGGGGGGPGRTIGPPPIFPGGGPEAAGGSLPPRVSTSSLSSAAGRTVPRAGLPGRIASPGAPPERVGAVDPSALHIPRAFDRPTYDADPLYRKFRELLRSRLATMG